MKRQKERARQEKQREKLERKRQRRLESKNRAADGSTESFQIEDDTSEASAQEPELDEPRS
ncbi:MAG: hypothetical protein L0Z53_09880 [Acidobacteriales bacterium]|nr:hypothetical protein [Terriglobales bacterium]